MYNYMDVKMVNACSWKGEVAGEAARLLAEVTLFKSEDIPVSTYSGMKYREGYTFWMDGIEWGVYKSPQTGWWNVGEMTTGLGIGGTHKTRTAAMTEAACLMARPEIRERVHERVRNGGNF